MPTPNKSAVEVLEAFFHASNRHDTNEMAQFFEERADVLFEETPMSVQEYIEECGRIFKAFPDLTFHWKSIESHGPDGAIMPGLYVLGTHKGPYAFGPYPEIAATNKVCRNDPEDFTIWLGPTGKIRKAKIIPKGEMTGPAGLYTQIGGLVF